MELRKIKIMELRKIFTRVVSTYQEEIVNASYEDYGDNHSGFEIVFPKGTLYAESKKRPMEIRNEIYFLTSEGTKSMSSTLQKFSIENLKKEIV